jgi:SpoIID/LytB domain protein
VRRRPTSVLLALALAVSLLPAAAASAQTGTPLRPAVRDTADPNPDVVLRGRGWGHSVGMSQYGAYAMARAGRSHSEILQHYYPGTSLHTYPADASRRVTVTGITGTLANAPVEAVGGPLEWFVCGGDGSCSPVGGAQQPAGARWQVISGGSANPSRVTLCRAVQSGGTGARPSCPSGSTAYTGTGTLQLRLSDRDTFPAAFAAPRSAARRIATGGRQYAYGWFNVRGDAGNVRIDNTLPMEGYLRGLAEVPSSWGGGGGGQHALEAQAIIARTYVLARGRNTCATPACQVFNGYGKELEATGANWVAAVRDPADRILRHGDGYAQTYYSSSHGGRTEASEDSWAYGGAVPYLRSVDDPWSLQAPNPMRAWSATATNAEFRRVTGTGLSRIQRVEVTSRTPGGSPRSLRLTGPEGTRDFSTTPTSARTSRGCNRSGYAGNSLRCDLSATVRDVNGAVFSGAGGQPPSSQIVSVGFAPFTDDDGGAHEYATVWANRAGIALGTSDTTFAPRRAVTRAQMASFLARTFAVPARTDRPFRDVSGGPHADAIASVAAAGIARGYEDGRFRPEDPVTREQMASFLSRAMGLSTVRADFRDVPPGGVHAGAVGAIADRGITTGCAADRFCPGASVTRDQMTAFLYRAVRSLR